MNPPHVINTVLSGPLPHRAPYNRTTPQLCEFQVIQGNVLAQIPLNILPTMSTVPQLRATETFFVFLLHSFQIMMVSRHKHKQGLWPNPAKVAEFTCCHKRQVLLFHIMKQHLMKSDVHVIIRSHHPNTTTVRNRHHFDNSCTGRRAWSPMTSGVSGAKSYSLSDLKCNAMQCNAKTFPEAGRRSISRPRLIHFRRSAGCNHAANVV